MSEMYDIRLAEKIINIKDEELLKFYIDSVISKIERIIGYSLSLKEYNDYLYGVNKMYAYTKGRPLKEILHVAKNNLDITNLCFIESERKIGLPFELCSQNYIEANYKAGYKILPNDLQLFIFSQVSSIIKSMNNVGLKSYSIETISYTFIDNQTSDDNFVKNVKNMFGVI